MSEDDFKNMDRLILKVFKFVIKKRIVKNEQFEELYSLLLQEFPDKEKNIKELLVDILSTL